MFLKFESQDERREPQLSSLTHKIKVKCNNDNIPEEPIERA